MIVRLRGISKIAKEEGLFATAIKLGDNNYVTGQSIIPGDKKTSENLTLDEMTGKTPLSEEKMKKFSFIISPTTIYKFNDGHAFDTKTAEGNAMLDFIKITSSNSVANSKSQVIRGKHSFYLEDKVKESEVKISKLKTIVKAGNLLADLSKNDTLLLADYFYTYENDSNCGRDKAFGIIEGVLSDYAQKSPSKIINALKPENKNWLRVSNIVMSGILTKRNGEYFEGNTYIASNFESLVEQYNSNTDKSSRWDKKLSVKDKNAHVVFEEPNHDAKELKTKYLEAKLDGNDEECQLIEKLIRSLNDEELMEFLIKHRTKKVKDESKIEPLTYTKEELIESIENDHFMTFKKKFHVVHPDTQKDFTVKEDYLKFLNK